MTLALCCVTALAFCILHCTELCHICTASVSHSNCTATCHITINCSNILHNIIKLSVFKVSHCSALRTVLTFWYTRPKIYFRILLLFETVQISFLSELHYHEAQLHSVSFREKDWRSFGLHIAQDGIVTTAKISPDLNHILWTIPDIRYCGQYLIFDIVGNTWYLLQTWHMLITQTEWNSLTTDLSISLGMHIPA